MIVQGLLDKLIDGKSMYKFSHDRIKEGALELVPNDEELRRNFHLRIGRQLRRVLHNTITDNKNKDNAARGGTNEYAEIDPQNHVACRLLFTSVHHMNRGSDRINDLNEKVTLATMNLQAAQVVLERSLSAQ